MNVVFCSWICSQPLQRPECSTLNSQLYSIWYIPQYLPYSHTHSHTSWAIVDCWLRAGRVVQSPIQSVNEANLKFSDRPFITEIALRSYRGWLKMCFMVCVHVCVCIDATGHEQQQLQQLPRKFLFHSISLMGADSQTPLWRREREGKSDNGLT